MTNNYSSNKPVNRFKPKKLKRPSTSVKKDPRQVKQEKIARLKDQVAKLRQQKAAMRVAYQQKQRDTSAAEFRGKLDAIDQKITQKMQQMRDVAFDAVEVVKKVATAPAVATKRVWDDWEI